MKPRVEETGMPKIVEAAESLEAAADLAMTLKHDDVVPRLGEDIAAFKPSESAAYDYDFPSFHRYGFFSLIPNPLRSHLDLSICLNRNGCKVYVMSIVEAMPISVLRPMLCIAG